MWVVLFVVLMDIVGIGIIAPIFPFYALRLGAGAEAATFCMALYTAALVISTPAIGAYQRPLRAKTGDGF